MAIPAHLTRHDDDTVTLRTQRDTAWYERRNRAMIADILQRANAQTHAARCPHGTAITEPCKQCSAMVHNA